MSYRPASGIKSKKNFIYMNHITQVNDHYDVNEWKYNGINLILVLSNIFY